MVIFLLRGLSVSEQTSTSSSRINLTEKNGKKSLFKTQIVFAHSSCSLTMCHLKMFLKRLIVFVKNISNRQKTRGLNLSYLIISLVIATPSILAGQMNAVGYWYRTLGQNLSLLET